MTNVHRFYEVYYFQPLEFSFFIDLRVILPIKYVTAHTLNFVLYLLLYDCPHELYVVTGRARWSR